MFRNQTFSKWRLFCYYVTKTDHPCESAAVRRNSIHFIGWRFTSLHAVSEYFTISGVFKWRHTGIYSGQSVVWMTSCFTVGMKMFYFSCRLLLPKGKWPTVSTQEVVQDTRGKITCLSLNDTQSTCDFAGIMAAIVSSSVHVLWVLHYEPQPVCISWKLAIWFNIP